MTPLLRVRNLCKKYEAGGVSVQALHDVDLDLMPGDTLGLVGESGCGKTTLARCALRLIEPDSGTVEFDGMDMLALPQSLLRNRRREFQFVFQDAHGSLDPRMTVRETLLEPFQAHRLGTREERETWIAGLMDSVALDPDLLRQYPSALSGGQQQRVGIARALALKPRLLIADEPVSALDASVQAQILNLLAELQGRFGLTLILISHSLAVVHYLCTRVVVMYLGRVVEEAPAAEFFKSPRHPYSRLLLASVPGLDLGNRFERTAGAGDVPSPANPPTGCPFHPRCPHVFARCREETPVLLQGTDGAKAACFLT